MAAVTRAVQPVVICGGVGSRLWPLSRAGFSKQFLCLTGKASLFQDAVMRLMDLSGECVNAAAQELGALIRWQREGVDEKGYWQTPEGDKITVAVDPRYFRPTEVETLLGDPSKAKAKDYHE